MSGPSRRERGFTLVELMVATAIAGVVIASLFGTMLMQQQGYMAQMELSEASQNARAALDIVKQNLRTAGWGMISTTGGGGVPAVGTCYNPNLTLESTCNDLAALNTTNAVPPSDRVRLIGITPGTTFSRATTWSGSNRLVVTDSGTPQTRTALSVGDLAVISGKCADNNANYNGVVKITAVSVSSPSWTYTFDPSIGTTWGYPAFSCASVNNGFAFGLAHIVEFYIDRSVANPDISAGASPTSPRLMMFTNRGGRDPASTTGGLTVEQVVAYDIDSLQVRYALDCGQVPAGNTCGTATSTTADDIVDYVAAGQRWCNDLRNVNCATGLADLENQQRVMAVQVAVVPRTRDLSRRILNDEQHTTVGTALNVFGAIIPADGYKRWIYRATVALRNNQLAVTSQ